MFLVHTFSPNHHSLSAKPLAALVSSPVNSFFPARYVPAHTPLSFSHKSRVANSFLCSLFPMSSIIRHPRPPSSRYPSALDVKKFRVFPGLPLGSRLSIFSDRRPHTLVYPLPTFSRPDNCQSCYRTEGLTPCDPGRRTATAAGYHPPCPLNSL